MSTRSVSEKTAGPVGVPSAARRLRRGPEHAVDEGGLQPVTGSDSESPQIRAVIAQMRGAVQAQANVPVERAADLLAQLIDELRRAPPGHR
jgi:hypothetical protein